MGRFNSRVILLLVSRFSRDLEMFEALRGVVMMVVFTLSRARAENRLAMSRIGRVWPGAMRGNKAM